MNILSQHLRKNPKFASSFLGLSLVVLLGVLDYLTGPFLSFELFFILPISIAVWFGGRKAGIFISLASASAWFLADILAAPFLLSSFIPYWNTLMKLGFFLLVVYFLPLLREAWERERVSARTDYLTGAANKRYFFDLLFSEIQRSRRHSDSFTVAYLDIDNFKIVNDRFGHASGDTLLRIITDTLRKNVRAYDVIARLGGDEFALSLIHI